MHCIIVGVTKYGKTTLCRQIATDLLKQGKPVAICDILPPVGWPAGCIFVRPDNLVQFVESQRGYYLFCDEASDYIGHRPEYQNIVKRAANYRHYCYVVAQRYKMLHPSTRSQCSAAIVFRQSVMDARMIADDRAQPSFIEAAGLAPGEYLYYASPTAGVVKKRIF